VSSRRFFLLPLAAAAAFVAFAAATASAHTEAASSGPSVSRCGAQWQLRTLSDANRRRVNMNAQSSSVAALGSRSRPGSPSSRDAFERQAYEVTAQVVKYRADSQGLHMLLFKDDAYMYAFLPSSGCLPSYARGRSVMVATRAWFNKNCGAASSSWKPLGALVRVVGVGYWGSRSLSGAASNGAELAPVVGMHPLAGCGAQGG
jgi:hypothetical protein